MWELRIFRARAAVLGVLVALVSCGGGGGGSDGGGGGGAHFTLSQSSVTADYFERDMLPSLQVTATATGSLPDTMYIGAVDEGTAIDPTINAFLNGNQASFLMIPKANLAPGTYTGNVRLMACRDQACTRHIGNSPLRLAYSLRVRQDLRVTPAATSPEFTGVSGTPISQVFTVQRAEGAADFTVEARGAGLDNVCSASEQTATTVRITARSMPVGVYNCAIVFRSGARGYNVLPTYRYTAPPGGEHGLSVSQSSLTFSTVEGATATSQNLVVTPATWDASHAASVHYSFMPDGWLNFTSTAQGYSVQPSAANLPAGNYGATLRIAGPPPIGFTDVNVALTVGPGLVRPADRSIVVSSATTAAQLTAHVPVDLAGGPPVGYTAGSDANWLIAVNATATTPGSVFLDFDTAQFRALANGREHVAHVTITPARPNIAPVTFEVRVDKRIGQVTGLGPYLQISGKPARFYVRGVGFTAANDIVSRFAFGDIPNPTVTVINDTTLLVTAPAQSPGNHVVRVGNALNLQMPTRTLKIVAPANYPYGAIPTNHFIGSMLFDGERQRLYYTTTGTLQDSFHGLQGGSSWVPLTHSLTATNLGLSADGSQLLLGYAGAADADSLAYQMLGNVVGVGLTNGRNIPVTNDGRIWYYQDAIHNEEYVHGYDPSTDSEARSRVFADSRNPRLLAVPRDGEKLFVTTSNGYGLLHSSRIDEGVSDHFGGSGAPWNLDSISDDGQRVVSGPALFDGNLNFLGYIAESAYDAHYTTPLYTVLSPDGRRAYTLAYDRRDYFNEEVPLPLPFSQPRIYVSDTTRSTQGPIPLLGYFDITDFPVCRESAQCGINKNGTISPDGNTLFFGGSQNIVVVPVPDESTLQTAGLPPQKAQRSSAGPVMHLWRPNDPKH